MMRVLRAEFAKLKRARMLLWAGLAVVVYSGSTAGLAKTIMQPETVERISLSGGGFTEAAARGMYTPTWENYLRWMPQGISGAWGLLLFGAVTAYLFGREYGEGTIRNMFTLPVRREAFVAAKMLVLATWVLVLTLLALVVALVLGAFLGLDGFSWSLVRASLADSLLVSLLIYLTLPIVALLAMLGRGYLPPMLFTVGMMTVTMIVVSTDAARWFPWSMSQVLVGATYLPIPPSELVWGSWVVAAGAFVAGLALAFWYVGRAEVAQ